MFKHILLPTDGSELSDKAIKQGIRFAKSIGAKVTGLCVMPGRDPFFYEMKIALKAMEQIAKRCRKAAERHLEVIKSEAMELGVACEVVCEIDDHVYEAIIRVAEQRGCDLIMMASHGRRGFKALLIGSETQRVLTHSRIPVLVYRMQDTKQKDLKKFKHILLPTDGSELSDKAIEQGIRFAKSIGAKATSLSVMPKLPTIFYHARISPAALEEAARQCRKSAEIYLETVQKRAQKAGVDCEVVFEKKGSPYEIIIREAEQRGCDLIMMASHGQGGVGAVLLGSETQKVLTHSRIPVLVYR